MNFFDRSSGRDGENTGEKEMNQGSDSGEKGLVYEEEKNMNLAKQYKTIGSLVELEEALVEEFEKVKVKSPDYAFAPDQPEYAFEKNGERYPCEVSYQLDGLKLTVSNHESDKDHKVKIRTESSSEESIKNMFELIDELDEKHNSEYETMEETIINEKLGGNEEEDEKKEEKQKIVTGYSWEDVGGLKEQKKEIKKYVEWPLDNPEAFENLYIDPPRGIVLYGPPGTGKTLIAKTIASETKANFYSASASELTSKWYGNSSKKVEKLFEEAKEELPGIVFLDEVDSLFKDREGSHEATQRMVTTFLKNLDGIDELKEVMFIGATNRLEDVDEAILRSGRLGRQIEIPTPDREAREEILKIHTKNSPVGDLDYKQLSKDTEEMTGADLEELVNQAGFYSLERVSDSGDITKVKTEDLLIKEKDFYKALETL